MNLKLEILYSFEIINFHNAEVDHYNYKKRIKTWRIWDIKTWIKWKMK
jgi:hypothetical protein